MSRFSPKLTALFFVLNEEELRQLNLFIQSPLHNRHLKVQKLFELLRYVRSKRKEVPDNNWFFQRLFPNVAFDQKKLNHIVSYCQRSVLDFMAWHHWQSQKARTQLDLLQGLHQHRLESEFNRQAKTFEKQQAEQTLRNAHYHQLNYQFRVVSYAHTRSKGRNREFGLQEMVDSQDREFVAEKLKNAAILLSHQAVVKKEYNTGLLPAVLSHLEQRPEYLKVPAIAMYYHAYRALSNIELENDFAQLKKGLVAHATAFPKSELQDIYLLAINFCIRSWNLGKKRYMQDLFELYQNGLQAQVFIENGQLSRFTYNNIIIAGLKRKAFAWVYQFIYDYKDQLEEKHRESSFRYNLAKYYFDKGDYQEAMPLLLQWEYNDVLQNLNAKIMLAKMYYETDERESLEHALNSFQTYIYRKKILGYHRDIYLNFAQFLRKVLMVNPYDKKSIRQLKTSILEQKALTERDWLAQQLDTILAPPTTESPE